MKQKVKELQKLIIDWCQNNPESAIKDIKITNEYTEVTFYDGVSLDYITYKLNNRDFYK